MAPLNGRQKYNSSGNVRMAEDTVAMLSTSGTIFYLRYKQRENGFPVLYITTYPRDSIINIATLTGHEFMAMKDFFDLAFSLGSIITHTLDAEMQDRAEEGEHDFYRLYRQLPILALRSGVFKEYAEGLQERPYPVRVMDKGTGYAPY